MDRAPENPAVCGPGGALRGEFLAEYAPGEHQLLDAARRAMAPGWAALVIHLADFPPPGPRPHHGRVARAILDDAAQRHGGQVFSLRNGDVVLLGPTAALRAANVSRGPLAMNETLPERIVRLLRSDAPELSRLVSTWLLPEERELLLGYATERLAAGGAAVREAEIATRGASGEASACRPAAGVPGPMPDLLHRQTAIQLGGNCGAALRPLFREVAIAPRALRAQAGGEGDDPDPFMLYYLAGQLEMRMLRALPGEIGKRGALDAALAPRLHVNLAPASILSDAFAHFAGICRGRGIGLGVEITLVDAAADPDGLDAARRVLATTGITFVIDGVSGLALRLTNLAALAPDLLKFDWSARLPALPQGERDAVDAALARVGCARVVLTGADSETALHWGLGRGIRRFQGSHVDAMLGAGRISACPHGAAGTLRPASLLHAGCTLRQCIERASAVAPAGRHGCANLALLDAGAPPDQPAGYRAA